MMNNYLIKIDGLITKCLIEKEKPNSFGFLPEIIDSLELMKDIIKTGSSHPRY